MSVPAITASVCCIALFKAFAACCYTLDDKLIEATLAGGEAGGGLLSLLPGRKSDTLDKKLKPFLDGVAQDIKALAFTDGPERGQALLNSLHNEGTRIVSHTMPTLAKHLVEQKNGDWTEATALVLANIPSGMDFKPFREPGTVEREALTTVLDAFHQAMLAPKSLREGLQMALLQHIGEDVRRIGKNIEDVSKRIATRDQIEKISSILENYSDIISHYNNMHQYKFEYQKNYIDDREYLNVKGLRKRIEERKTENNRQISIDYLYIGRLLLQENTKLALQEFKRAVRIDHANFDAWDELGNVMIRLGRLSRAECAFEKRKIQ
ncbi:MAG: hypothetical protein AAGM04_14060 [Pseudomonadota bacterium]